MKTVTQLQREFEQAREECMTLQSRNCDRDTMERALQKAKNLKAQLELAQTDDSQRGAIDQLAGGMMRRGAGGPSIGAQLLNSEMGQWLIQNRGKFPTGVWTSPSSELPALDMMATTVDESGGSGGPLVIIDYQPGILPLPTRRLVIADLFNQGPTDSNTVGYMKESTFTNAAAPTAEGAAKPESTLVFTATTDAVRKIATFLPVTEELLEDVQGFRAYIDARLRTGVQLAEDDQLLNGSGTPPAIQGILNRSGLAAAQPRGTDTNADAIAKQIAAIETATNLTVDGIVLNPTNWLTITLAKDANGQYVGGSPFSTPLQPRLWGRRVAVTSAITANTALVGAFRGGGQIFRRGGLRVESTNSHQDFFQKNLVAIRAEERLALAIWRASAFGTVTGLT